jgi:hypothetical protein
MFFQERKREREREREMGMRRCTGKMSPGSCRGRREDPVLLSNGPLTCFEDMALGANPSARGSMVELPSEADPARPPFDDPEARKERVPIPRSQRIRAAKQSLLWCGPAPPLPSAPISSEFLFYKNCVISITATAHRP